MHTIIILLIGYVLFSSNRKKRCVPGHGEIPSEHIVFPRFRVTLPKERRGKVTKFRFQKCRAYHSKVVFWPSCPVPVEVESFENVACLSNHAQMVLVFFDVFDRLLLQRPKVCSIRQQKGDLKGLVCDLRQEHVRSSCFYLRYRAIFAAG